MVARSNIAVENTVVLLRGRIEILEDALRRERAAREEAEQHSLSLVHELESLTAFLEQSNDSNASVETSKPPFATETPDMASQPCDSDVQNAPIQSAQSEPPVIVSHVEPQKPSAPATAPIGIAPAPAVAPEPVVAPVSLATEGSAEQRRDKRMDTRLTASYWTTGMIEAASCTICDKSSGGARLECHPSGVRGRRTELRVGDQFTLSFESARERTSVVSKVMWAAGSRCGVKFLGQFHSTMKAARPTARVRPQTPPQKASVFGRLRSSGR